LKKCGPASFGKKGKREQKERKGKVSDKAGGSNHHQRAKKRGAGPEGPRPGEPPNSEALQEKEIDPTSMGNAPEKNIEEKKAEGRGKGKERQFPVVNPRRNLGSVKSFWGAILAGLWKKNQPFAERSLWGVKEGNTCRGGKGPARPGGMGKG